MTTTAEAVNALQKIELDLTAAGALLASAQARIDELPADNPHPLPDFTDAFLADVYRVLVSATRAVRYTRLHMSPDSRLAH